MKWNMGWMNDAVVYRARPGAPPVSPRQTDLQPDVRLYRELRAALVTRRVVHMKHSLLDKMPNDAWRSSPTCACFSRGNTPIRARSASWAVNWRNGTKWRQSEELDWALLQEANQRHPDLVRDLNQLYRTQPALHRHDFEQQA